jgi:hypothetical protein
MQMKCLWIGLLGALALVAGCASPLAVDGAPCPCPADYVCDPVLKRCVQPGAVTPPAQPPPDAGAPANPDPEATLCVQPGPVLTRPLGAWAYRETIRDLLGVTIETDQLPPDNDLPGEPASPFQEELADRYRKLAVDVAARAAANLTLPCQPDPPGQTACARAFAEGLGARALRRPLTPPELDELVDVYDQARRSYGSQEGYVRVIKQILASDQFYLRKEVGEPTGPLPGLRSLTQWEIAARLSYFLWGTIPDEELRAAAGRGELRTKAGVQAQAERMLASPRAEAMIADFHRRWLRLEEVRTVPKEGFPDFSPELREALLTSAQETPILSWWREGGNQSALFRGPLVANRAMSAFYGLSTPAGSGFEPLHPLGAQKRFGVLTLPAVMSVLGHNGDSAVVQRGSFVLRRYLCLELPLPPNLTVPPVREPQPDSTTRERFAEHSMNPTCWGCHGNMDPIGFALENYDGLGRWREYENGRRIDVSSGQVGDVLGDPFQGPEGLAQMLATRPDVAACMVHHWFTYALGRASLSTDSCTLRKLEEAFGHGNRTLRPLLLAIVRSDAFLTRVAP